jgi:hypothetical protein
MKRIILHWTAGRHTASATDRKYYHVIIQGDGTKVAGDHPISANKSPMKPSYAAHTRNCNTDSIGVAVAAMWNAKERPFDAGPAPITPAQCDALVKAVAYLCIEYGIPVRGDTVLTHAEVQPTLGIKQSGKWDIRWLPGLPVAGDPVMVGDMIRARVAAEVQRLAPPPLVSKPRPVVPIRTAPPPPAPPAPILTFRDAWANFLAMFKKG